MYKKNIKHDDVPLEQLYIGGWRSYFTYQEKEEELEHREAAIYYLLEE